MKTTPCQYCRKPVDEDDISMAGPICMPCTDAIDAESAPIKQYWDKYDCEENGEGQEAGR